LKRRKFASFIFGPLSSFRAGSVGGQLARGVSGSVIVQVIGLPLQLGSGVLLARSLGAASYGYYAYALAWLEFLKVPIAYGHPSLIQREVAINIAAGRWGDVRGLLRRTNQCIFLLSITIAAAFYLAASSSETNLFGTGSQVAIFQISLLTLPFFGLSAVRVAALNGLHRVTESLLAENIIRPLIVSMAVVMMWIVFGWKMNAKTAMIIQVCSVAITFCFGMSLLIRALPKQIGQSIPVYRTREWVSEVWPFMLTGGAYAFWGTLGIITLGWYRSPAEVGEYRVAVVLATLALLPITACNLAISPMIARLNAEKKHVQLQRMISISTTFLTLTSLVALIGFSLLGRPLLHYVFGGEYDRGYSALLILVAGHLLYSSIWSVMITLDMTGNQKFSLYALLSSAGLNIVLTPLLVPAFGISGAAAATALSWFLGHLWLVPIVERRLRLRPTLIFSIIDVTIYLREQFDQKSGAYSSGE